MGIGKLSVLVLVLFGFVSFIHALVKLLSTIMFAQGEFILHVMQEQQ